MTTYPDFLTLTKLAKASESTLRLWHHMYLWVEEKGYADTADTPEFLKYVCSFRSLKVGAINAHLRRMSKSGLLSRHVLRRKLPSELKEELYNPFLSLMTGSELPPTSFVRYCLPRQKCSVELKAIERNEVKAKARINEIIKRKNMQ